MRLVGLAQTCHPKLQELYIVLFSGSQDAEQLLRVFFGPTVHLGELEEDFHFTADGQK